MRCFSTINSYSKDRPQLLESFSWGAKEYSKTTGMRDRGGRGQQEEEEEEYHEPSAELLAALAQAMPSFTLPTQEDFPPELTTTHRGSDDDDEDEEESSGKKEKGEEFEFNLFSASRVARVTLHDPVEKEEEEVAEYVSPTRPVDYYLHTPSDAHLRQIAQVAIDGAAVLRGAGESLAGNRGHNARRLIVVNLDDGDGETKRKGRWRPSQTRRRKFRALRLEEEERERKRLEVRNVGRNRGRGCGSGGTRMGQGRAAAAAPNASADRGGDRPVTARAKVLTGYPRKGAPPV